MFYCYILRSISTGRRYVGSCEDVMKRVERHNVGKVPATKHGMPWTLVHTEEFKTRTEAIRRELCYKTGAGRDKLDWLEQSLRQNNPARGDAGAPRRLLSGVLILSTIAVSLLRAQEAAAPSVEVTPNITARPAASPTASVEPTIPPDLPEVSQLDELFKRRTGSLGRRADEVRLHAEWRRLRNQIANAPDVVAAKKAANAARTDLEKRRLLRRYYEICYAHMLALAREPDVKAGLEDMKNQHLKTLEQPRVRPSPTPAAKAVTENVGPSPSPPPTATPTAEEEADTSD